MSKFSGKCDLYDYMMMLVSHKEGNLFVSDEYECFNEFKKRTGGVLYQHYKIKVSEQNQNFVADHCDEFIINSHAIVKTDKRLKSGEKSYTYYTYEYYGKHYDNLKDLNKHGVYIKVEVKFDTLLDLIPYYPYIITCMFSDNDKSTIIISNESYVDSEFKSGLTYGHISTLNYKKVLQDHYKKVVLRYFNPAGREIIEKINITADMDLKHIKLAHAIDYQWEVEVIRDANTSIWASPKIIDAQSGIVDISEVWPGKEISSITLKYIRDTKFEQYRE